jgi:hypothetical protein
MSTEGEPSRPPFSLWAEERVAGVVRFDNQRLDAVPIRERRDHLPATGPELAWSARRRHAPCHRRVGPSAPLDCHYLRMEEEEGYAGRLSQLLLVPPDHRGEIVSWSFLCFPSPFVPHRWPRLPRVTDFPLREFPMSGFVHVAGEAFARDSAYALYISSTTAGHGDPGRFLAEHHKEAKARNRGWLVAWNQVEYYQLYPASRLGLYPHVPPDWAQWEVSNRMYVPLPPSVVYAGSGLISNNPLVWAICFSEWTVLVFSRWVTDGHHRGLLWQLPPKVRASILQLGVSPLLQGSPYHLARVDELFHLHDRVDWNPAAQRVSHSGVIPIHFLDGRFQPLTAPVSPSHPLGALTQEDEDDEGIILAVGVRSPRTDPLAGMRVGVPLRSRPVLGETVPEECEDANPVGLSGPGGLSKSGFRRDMDLSSTRIEEWLAHLGIYEGLNPYFPPGPMREEDIARAYAQLLNLQQSLRDQISQAERQLVEGESRQVRYDIEKERAVRELGRVQEDLALLMRCLSLGMGEESGGDPRS